MKQVFRYELFNLLRSKWIVGFALLFWLLTEGILQFGSSPSKLLVSLLHLTILLLPLFSLVMSLTSFYNSREFLELLLVHPVKRYEVFFAKYFAFTLAFIGAFIVGVLLPFTHITILEPKFWKTLFLILVIGSFFILIFTAFAFAFASYFEDKAKGLGFALVLWFFLALLYDGILLIGIFVFRDYPYEKVLPFFIFLNPIDLGRVTALLQLDISALMGYTGALFRQYFGGTGLLYSLLGLLTWTLLPLLTGFWIFQKKDF